MGLRWIICIYMLKDMTAMQDSPFSKCELFKRKRGKKILIPINQHK